MEITNEAYEAVVKYFEGLTHTGYKAYGDVNKLLAFLFIEEILYGDMSCMVTDNDYKAIVDAVYCLYGTCMLPYPSYLKGKETINNRTPSSFRITESNILRSIDSNLRTVL